jgi:hypothetical protein
MKVGPGVLTEVPAKSVVNLIRELNIHGLVVTASDRFVMFECVELHDECTVRCERARSRVECGAIIGDRLEAMPKLVHRLSTAS